MVLPVLILPSKQYLPSPVLHKPHLILCLLCTTEQTCPSGGDKTCLLTLCSISRDSRCFTNMLMITTTVRLEDILARHLISGFQEKHTWSTGFIATPRVFGHEFLLTANLCLARDASGRRSQLGDVELFGIQDILNSGLSVRPPPATIPTIPLAVLLITFFAPLGSLTLVLPSSGL